MLLCMIGFMLLNEIAPALSAPLVLAAVAW